MPNFRIRVQDKEGNTSCLNREFQSKQDLLHSLKNEGFTVLHIDMVESNLWSKSLNRPQGKALSLQATHDFCRSLRILITAGSDIEKGLRSIQRENSGYQAEMARDLADRVLRGEQLSTAIKHNGAFSPIQTSLLRAGEAGGTLSESLLRIEVAAKKSLEIRKNTIHAISYPAFVLLFGIVTLIVMLIFILPKFSAIYEEMQADLPWHTTMMLGVSEVIRGHFLWIVLAVGVCAVVLRPLFHWVVENGILERVVRFTPVLGPLVGDRNASTLLRNLGMLLQSGLPLSAALALCEQAAQGKEFRKSVVELRASVVEGNRFSQELRKKNLLSETIISMVAVGEASGKLHELLLSAADVLDEKVDNKIKKFLTLFEPILLISVGLVVAVMVMGMLSPIFGLSASLRR